MQKYPEYHNFLKYVSKDLIRDIFKYANEYALLDWININKIEWKQLLLNPNAIRLLEQNQNKINWDNLSKNLNAIHLLEQNQRKIDWHNLSQNPNIFVLKYNV
jgi:hypothetical protein